ncbi:MAG: PEGA domain-containing protein [Lentisphaerae bacterium]|nr:PEGA domain-containing protein [Lentisphaerota bacterium]
MKRVWMIAMGMGLALTGVRAAPLRAVVLNFENRSFGVATNSVTGAIDTKALAGNGLFALAKALAGQTEFVLIDREDLMKHMEQPGDKAKAAGDLNKPSFLRAAQALNADVVLRGSLVSCTPSKQILSPGGIKTEFLTLTVRVAVEALDVRDGAILAMGDAEAKRNFRQSEAEQTVLGESDLITLLQEAVEKAVPEVKKALAARLEEERQRPMASLSLKTDVDPAMVEIDGLLIGTTPIKNLKIYKGDHTITIGKAGYRDENKRLLIDADQALEISLIRTELSADELKSILEKARLNVGIGMPSPVWIIQEQIPDIKAGK